jgi:DNA polymerase III sliding clamp (beta) subunit (PCNA family)
MNLMSRIWLIKRGYAENSVLPALKAVHVYEGRMQSSDGKIVIDVECPELKDLTFSVNGSKFVKAIEACDGEPDSLKVTETMLIVKKAKFTAKLPLLSEQYPRTEFNYLSEAWTKIAQPLKPAIKAVLPFVGIDASRPWCCGALFTDNKVYATNNVTVVSRLYALINTPAFNLPSFAMIELAALENEPKRLVVEENHVTFDYGRFMFRTQLLSPDWPDVSKMLSAVTDKIPTIPQGLPDAVEKVVNFCPDADFQCIVFDGEGVTTTEGDISAAVEGFELPKGRYRAVVLQSVLAHATHADFSFYPNAIPFRTSDGLTGVFVGVRNA